MSRDTPVSWLNLDWGELDPTVDVVDLLPALTMGDVLVELLQHPLDVLAVFIRQLAASQVGDDHLHDQLAAPDPRVHHTPVVASDGAGLGAAGRVEATRQPDVELDDAFLRFSIDPDEPPVTYGDCVCKWHKATPLGLKQQDLVSVQLHSVFDNGVISFDSEH